MKLTRIQIRNFRTFGGDHKVDLVAGVNCFVGPNNCGKSNLFNAVAMVLDSGSVWKRERDMPTFMLGGRPPVPRITLSFKVEGVTGPEKTLLQLAERYEKSVASGRRTFAADGEIRCVTAFASEGARQRSFLARGAGARTAAAGTEELRALEAQFDRVLRLVLIRSGESLESLLAGRFREICT